MLAIVAVAGAIGGIVFVLAQGLTAPSAIAAGIAYGLLLADSRKSAFRAGDRRRDRRRQRAIVFNGDVMNTAARLEELSRDVDGGFLASRAAMERFSSVPPFAFRDLGRLPIRGRADGIDVVCMADAP